MTRYGFSVLDRRNKNPFPKDSYKDLFEAEKEHWWFKSRNNLILWILENKIGAFQDFLEVGCGTGYVIKGISEKFISVTLNASEYHEEGLIYARKRLPNCKFTKLDVTTMTEIDAYDCIGSFDVLEHINDDQVVLENLYRSLRLGGYLIITVPQHPWLWSQADHLAHHIRRYTSSDLIRKARIAGFRIEYKTSFVSLLLPIMAIQRLSSRNETYDANSEFRISKLLNIILYCVMSLEIQFLKWGARLPAGGSLLLLARKI